MVGTVCTPIQYLGAVEWHTNFLSPFYQSLWSRKPVLAVMLLLVAEIPTLNHQCCKRSDFPCRDSGAN